MRIECRFFISSKTSFKKIFSCGKKEWKKKKKEKFATLRTKNWSLTIAHFEKQRYLWMSLAVSTSISNENF